MTPEELDNLCNSFEQAWAAGDGCRLEDALAKIAEAERTLTFETEQRVMGRVQTQLETVGCG